MKVYLVSNIVKGDVIISDLRVTIPCHKALDLHAVKTAIIPEKSKDLRRAISMRKIIVVRHDVKQVEKIIQKETIIKESAVTEKKIADIIRKELSKLNQANNNQSSDMQKLIQTVQTLADRPIQGIKKREIEVEEDDIDSDKLREIHKRTLDKKLKGITSSPMQIEKEEIHDENFLDNVDELFNLASEQSDN